VSEPVICVFDSTDTLIGVIHQRETVSKSQLESLKRVVERVGGKLRINELDSTSGPNETAKVLTEMVTEE
jgi:ferritin-like metal-binding protein YciE